MELKQTTQTLRQDLMNLAQIGDPSFAEATSRLWSAYESLLQSRLMELASEWAGEASAQLPSGHLEVRLSGSAPSLAYVPDEPVVEVPHSAEDTARITVRLPPALKQQVDACADRDGTSVNTWVVAALATAVGGRRPPRSGKSLTGYGRG